MLINILGIEIVNLYFRKLMIDKYFLILIQKSVLNLNIYKESGNLDTLTKSK